VSQVRADADVSCGEDAGFTTNPDAPDNDGSSSESVRWRYGLLAALAAVFAILAAFVFAALRYSTAGDVSTSLAAITGTLGTILGAYLGVSTLAL
jgi:hypothetical protein